MPYLMLLTFFTLFTLNTNASITSVYSTKDKNFISYEDLIHKAGQSEIIVLGEFHNDELIQKAQAKIISDTTELLGKQKKFNVMWEFFNFTEQKEIDQEFDLFKKGQISSTVFVNKLSHSDNHTYAPIFDVVKELGGNVWGLNLPRELKQKVMKEGINSIDPKLVPPGHYVGGNEYLERFAESMGGHVPPEKLQPYFLAQCLTDSVMAYHANLHHNDLSFIIAGSFHTDFYDATVVRLKKLTDKHITTLKIVGDLDDDERAEYVAGSTKYGAYADFIIFTR